MMNSKTKSGNSRHTRRSRSTGRTAKVSFSRIDNTYSKIFAKIGGRNNEITGIVFSADELLRIKEIKSK